MTPTSFQAVHTTWGGYKRARLRFFHYRYGATVTEKAALALGFAALTGIAAQVRLYLPFTPVPITLQTFAVLLAGVVLGARWGGASQAFYATLGAAGVPWFAGLSGGLGSVFGPSGGYIVGFVVAAGFVGYLTDRYRVVRRTTVLAGALLLANFVVIYGVGLPWLFGWLTLASGSAPSMLELLTMGLFPFVVGDLVKVVGAIAVAKAILPTTSYGPERT